MKMGAIDPTSLAVMLASHAVKSQLKKVAVEVQRRAREKAPVRTGALRDGIEVVEERDPKTGRLEYRVGWNKATAWYGGWVELGTRKARARPHLRPAADEVNRGR